MLTYAAFLTRLTAVLSREACLRVDVRSVFDTPSGSFAQEGVFSHVFRFIRAMICAKIKLAQRSAQRSSYVSSYLKASDLP